MRWLRINIASITPSQRTGRMESDGEVDGRVSTPQRSSGVPQTAGDDGAAVTPSFAMMFSIYDTGRGSIATEHLSALFQKMGYTVARDQLEKFLDELDPDATGDISKVTFLKWFEKWGDALDDPEEVAAHVADNTSPFRDNDGNDECSTFMADATSIQSAMLEAKMQRKRAEEDVQLLANRLAHLRTEEKKAQKKIDEANKRAEDIEAIKRRNAEHQRLKREHLERTTASVRHTLVTNSKASIESCKKKEQAITAMVKQRAKVVQDTKLDAKILAEEKARQLEIERKRLALKTQAIKEKEKEAARVREEARKRREKALEKAARTKLADEYKKKVSCMHWSYQEGVVRVCP
ncbi:hypothetical protein DYB32_008851 [Aphanomyces invadans]|uniref:EF-hand domain-containing protein n=1 Tax=Aphanomyces invadans TaxID=157072 RepID=A0A3R6VRG7_9STRA|nr:hypothetical protein DYB32_008851 [Aphanomyces invadans]